MRAAMLRHQVKIQQLVAGSPQQTGSGAPDVTWTDLYASVSASIEPLRGRELEAAQAIASEAMVRIRIRYRTGITAAMRVVHTTTGTGTRYYNIVVLLDRNELHRELELMCTQGLIDG